MLPNQALTPEAQEKQRLFIERARKGVLKLILDKGTPVDLGTIGDFTLQKFFIQHQALSRLIEGLIEDQLLAHNEDAGEFSLTEQGKVLASQN